MPKKVVKKLTMAIMKQQVEPIASEISATSVESPRKSTRERKEPDRLVVKTKSLTLCAQIRKNLKT